MAAASRFARSYAEARAKHWLHNHPEAHAMRPAIRKAVRDAFCVDEDDWKDAVCAEAQRAALATVLRLA